MPTPISGYVGEQNLADGAQGPTFSQGQQGEALSSLLHGRYSVQARRQRLFWAHAIVTAPVIYTTAAGTGGPLLWNGSSEFFASILAITVPITVVSTVAAALGLTGNTGQTSAPASTTAIDSRTNAYIGGPQGNMSVYRVGTPTNAGGFFIPLSDLHTGALTVDNLGVALIDIGGSLIVPPQCWASIAASATATTTVGQLGMLYEEIPLK